MARPSEPPPSQTILAAAAGGFGGAVLGAVAASMMMGGDDGNERTLNLAPEKAPVEAVVADNRRKTEDISE